MATNATGYEGPGYIGGGGTGAGGAAISAGTNSQNTGTIQFSNSNGVSFGLNTNGVLTATVTPGAAAGIAAFQVSNTTYTSGTVLFQNANGLTFGSSGAGGVSASYTVPGATSFSNANGVTFGLAGSTVTASYSQASKAFSASGGSSTFNTLSFSNANGATFSNSAGQIALSYTVPGATSFSNANGVSFGLAGSTITASVSQTVQPVAVSGSNGSFAFSTLTFGALNGLSFYTSAGSLVGSYTVPAGGASPNFSAGTTSGNLGSVVFSNSNGVSFGLNGSTITGSVSQTAQTLGQYALGNTTGQSSSNTADARSLSFSGSGIISVGLSGNTYIISAPAAVALTQLSVGVSTGGNTAGSTGLFTGQVVFAGGANITLSGSTSSNSATYSIIGGAGGGGVNISAGTQLGTSGSIVFSNSNGISFGMSNSSIVTASYTVPGATSFSNLNGVTFGLAGSTITASVAGQTSLSFSNLNGVTFGTAGSTLTASVNPGVSAISAGTTSVAGGAVVFSNSNSVSFGLAGSTLTASFSTAAQTAQTVGLYALGNTTQNSSTTLDARTMSFNALGAMTMGYSGGSIQVSAPATSSLSATGLASISVNGSTISIGAALVNQSKWNFWPTGAFSSSQQQNASASFRYLQVPQPVTFSRVDVPAIVSLGSAVTAATADLNISSGLVIYSRNGSTLSPIAGAFGTTTYTWASNSANFSNLTGGKNFSFPINGSLSPGEYWVGFQLSTTNNSSLGLSTTLLGNTISIPFGLWDTGGGYGDFGATNATSNNLSSQGIYTGTITATNQTIAMSNISATGTQGQAGNFPLIFRNY